jgi:hypothetical protein
VNGLRGTDIAAGSIGLALTGFLSLLNLLEWYTIAILQQVDDYPFGREGPAPYYYRTSALYSTVMFAWGVVFLINFSWLFFSVVKGERTGVNFGFGLSLILLILMFSHAQIGLD